MKARTEAQFAIGDVVEHVLFEYRGVIFDVDPTFQQTEEWYEKIAKSCPPRDKPWYHVLPDGATHTTYVAERNLRASIEPKRIHHPMIESVFSGFDGTKYSSRTDVN